MVKSVIIACLLWFCTTGAHAMGTDSVIWRWSPYISTGVGTPNGLRTEVGMHIAAYGSLAITHGLYASWTRESTRPMFGFNARVFVPVDVPLHPYVLVGGAGTIEIFGGSDEYWQAMIGGMIEITPWLHARPEIGAVQAKKHISGGPGLWGGTPEVFTRTLYMCAHIGIELDIVPMVTR